MSETNQPTDRTTQASWIMARAVMYVASCVGACYLMFDQRLDTHTAQIAAITANPVGMEELAEMTAQLAAAETNFLWFRERMDWIAQKLDRIDARLDKLESDK